MPPCKVMLDESTASPAEVTNTAADTGHPVDEPGGGGDMEAPETLLGYDDRQGSVKFAETIKSCEDDPSETNPPSDPDAEFAAALSARLDKLDNDRGMDKPDTSPYENTYESSYENPSSMETQGDALGQPSDPPSVESMDPIDMDMRRSPEAYVVPDIPEPSFPTILPLFGPLPDPANREFDPFSADDTVTGGIFDDIGASDTGTGDVSSTTAESGVCGLRNLGNTCFMNSGLQCVLATPSVVDFFLGFPMHDVERDPDGKNNVEEMGLSKKFAALVKQMYSGEFSVVSPVQFKDLLAESHTQFRGIRQHDCQEFLALLLDTLHQQLVLLHPINKGPMSECTSMELHTPHSTEVSCDGKDNVFTFVESGKMLETRDVDSVSDLDRTGNGNDLESVSDLERDGARQDGVDGSESRGSASPKSYTSHSSLEDKIPVNIRMAPIPECIKTTWSGGSRASLASLDSHNTESDLELVDDDSVGAVTSNLVPPDQLKKKQVVFSDTNLTLGPGEQVDIRNNAVSPLNVDIEDFLKDHKTLNVNMSEAVNGTEAMNNKINFDSEKYRHGYLDNTRPSQTIENLNHPDNSQYEKNINVAKRTKMTNTDFMNDCHESLDGEVCGKRMRLESTEKNLMMETERREADNDNTDGVDSQSEPPYCGLDAARDPARLKEAIEADRYWEKYLTANNTVMAHSFQGQFKNTVICNGCGHLSVSFEPFMYLSLALPRALDKQVEVVVLKAGELPLSYCITLSRHDKVADLRAAVGERMEVEPANIALAEVLRHKVSRKLEDNTWLRFVNDTNRKIYALEILSIDIEEVVEEGNEGTAIEGAKISECLDISRDESSSVVSSLSSSRSDLDSARTSTTVSSSASTGTLTEAVVELGWKSCAICLEDMADSDLLTHIHCSCVICRQCLQRSMKHQGESGDCSSVGQKCPVCLGESKDEEWLQVDQAVGVRPPLRMLTLPVVMRMEGSHEKVVLFGHPRMLRVPNMVKVAALTQLLEAQEVETGWRLCLVDEGGEDCSRCGHSARCRGCDVNRLAEEGGELLLKPGDSLALHYSAVEKNRLEEVNRTRMDASMFQDRAKTNLNLYDCLEAFSHPEQLDQNNPWFCPMCRNNQTATKTLSVWRYPDFLIVYLKRFVYLERGGGSVKLDNRVEFPLSGLDLTPYLSGPLQQGGEQFQLYASVCHTGTPSGGHYTAYSLHPLTNTWHHYNDSTVSQDSPVGENQNDVYVLFYKRSGFHYSVNMPEFTQNTKFFAGGKENRENDVLMEENPLSSCS